jgi:hypothetical protein
MTGYRAPFAALAAMIAKVFTTKRSTRKTTHLVALFPAIPRTTIRRSRLLQRDEGVLSRRRSVDRD